jgi:hypothetical protein
VIGDLDANRRSKTMTNDTNTEGQQIESPAEGQPADTDKSPPPAETEFKIQVRKLKVPARPRGVLAE